MTTDLSYVEALIQYVEDPNSPATEAVTVALVVAKVHAPKLVDELRLSRTVTIETGEEINALPTGSVILDIDRDVWQRYGDIWMCIAEDAVFHHPSHYLPVTLLHRGEPRS